MKLLWSVCVVSLAILGPSAVVAQTDPSVAFEEATENQTEASPVIEEVTEHADKAIVEFDTAEGFTESPENAVGIEITPEKVPGEPESKTVESHVMPHEVNVTLELPGESHTVPDVANDITEKINHVENKTEEVVPEVVEGVSTNVTLPEPPRTGEALDLALNHTGKDLSHDTIAHYPFNNWTGVGLPLDEVEQFPVNQTEEITHAQEDIIHQLANFTDNEVITDHAGITLDDLTDDLRTWQAPEYFTKNFPYYLSGYDFDDRPIWVAEFGKYDMMKLVSMGPKVLADFEKYVAQAARILTDSHKWKSPDVNTIAVIIDFDGLRLTQYAQIPTLNFVLKLARDYAKILEQHLELVVVINVNYVTQSLINFVRPIFATIFRIVEFHGSDKSKWLPHLLRHFPRESLPEWYGGNKSWTPVKVLG